MKKFKDQITNSFSRIIQQTRLTPLILVFSILTILVLGPVPAIANKDRAPAAKKTTLSEEMYTQRVEHAAELLGRHYANSVVRTTESIDKINGNVYRWTRSSLPKSFRNRHQKIAQAIIDEAHRYSFDPVFLMAVIQSESSFDPRKSGGAGEIGLMQILPTTGEWIAKKFNIRWKGEKTLRDPVENIRIGAAYLNWLREKFDSHARLYLAAYNMGQTNVRAALGKKIWPKDYPIRVMQNYVAYYADIKGSAPKEQREKLKQEEQIETLAQNDRETEAPSL